MPSRAAAAFVSLTAAVAITAPPSFAIAREQTASAKCGLHYYESDGFTGYLEPITGRKNISCEQAQKVAAAAVKATNHRLWCTKKTRYRKWTIRHAGYAESLSARFTKGSQRFRIQSQGSCK